VVTTSDKKTILVVVRSQGNLTDEQVREEAARQKADFSGGTKIYVDVTAVRFDTNQVANAVTIGPNFLYGCTGLVNIDLAPLANVTSIGEGFLGR